MRLACIPILEVGQFQTDSGHVNVPTGTVPFPMSALGTLAVNATATVSFAGTSTIAGVLAASASAAVDFEGASHAAGAAALTASGAVAFAGEDLTPPGVDDDFMLLL